MGGVAFKRSERLEKIGKSGKDFGKDLKEMDFFLDFSTYFYIIIMLGG